METSAISALIDLATINEYVNERREYIGASGIGDPCNAYQSLCLRGFESEIPSPKLMRIFRDGKRIEDVVIGDMKAAGIKVEEIDPATGKQWRFTAFGGLMSASLDGIVTLPSGDRCPLEIKSMNRALFAKFKNHGLAKSHPHYVDQMNVGMGLARHYAGCTFHKALMVAYCKDTSEYHSELISYDALAFGCSIARVYGIIEEEMDKRISTHANAYVCKDCFKRTACWEPASLQNLGCKQCYYAKADSGTGEWDCQLTPGAFGVKCKSFRVYKVKPYGQTTATPSLPITCGD